MTTEQETWLQPPYLPQPVTDLDIAFPAHVQHLMPDPDLIPDGYPDQAKWEGFQRTWFMHGLSKDSQFALKDGIDGETAFRHLKCIQGSFWPKHEWKVAAVAYLASLWFEDGIWEKA